MQESKDEQFPWIVMACVKSTSYILTVHDPTVEDLGHQNLCLGARTPLLCCCFLYGVLVLALWYSLELSKLGAGWRQGYLTGIAWIWMQDHCSYQNKKGKYLYQKQNCIKKIGNFINWRFSAETSLNNPQTKGIYDILQFFKGVWLQCSV